MAIRFCVVLIAALVSKQASAQSENAVDCVEQLRASAVPGATTTVKQGCLRLGQVVIGMSRDDVERMIGPADLNVSGPTSCMNAVYVLPRNLTRELAAHPVEPTALDISTLRLVYRGDRVAVVEADGRAARSHFGFGSLQVGDTAKTVEQLLGSDHASDQVWSYGHLLLLFDDDVSTVSAIAITEGEDAFGCLLPATFLLSLDAATGAARGFTVIRPPEDEVRLHGLPNWPGTIVRIPPRNAR
ncbi:MAG TPA: hypothetical protein DEP35_05070 [Deltaproteobacteria bacterium]|nr:hypothetical protein [Deltaproteobacteria bacterium]